MSREGGGEDVGGPEISAGVEARNLGVSGIVTGLSSSVDECGDRVVARPQQVAWAAPVSKQRREKVRWTRRTPSAGGPNHCNPRARARIRGEG